MGESPAPAPDLPSTPLFRQDSAGVVLLTGFPPRAADVLLMALSVLSAAAAWMVYEPSADAWLGLVISGVAVVLLWWRRTQTIPIAAAILTLHAMGTLTVGPYSGATATLVIVYTVAAYRDLRPAAIVAIVAVLCQFLPSPDFESVAVGGDTLWTALFFALGLFVRSRRERVQLLRERNDALRSERDQRAQLAVAAERTRIAREMHDLVSHNLTVMITLSEGAAMTERQAPEKAQEAMTQVATVGRNALRDMRRLLGVLRDEPGADGSPQPGLKDLDDLIARLQGAGLPTESAVAGEIDSVPDGLQTACFRIAQESLTNALRYGPKDDDDRPALGAANRPARIEITITSSRIDLTVTSPLGAGEDWEGGNGILGMKERARAFDGRLDAQPTGDQWVVSATMPLGGDDD